MKPVSLNTQKMSCQTDFNHYKQVLERAHANLKQQEEDRIADMELIKKMEEDPTFIETLPTTKSSYNKNNTNPAIYIVDPKHTEGMTLGEAAKALGVSSRSVAMIRQGTPLSSRSINQIKDMTGMSLKKMLTPENYEEISKKD